MRAELDSRPGFQRHGQQASPVGIGRSIRNSSISSEKLLALGGLSSNPEYCAANIADVQFRRPIVSERELGGIYAFLLKTPDKYRSRLFSTISRMYRNPHFSIGQMAQDLGILIGNLAFPKRFLPSSILRHLAHQDPGICSSTPAYFQKALEIGTLIKVHYPGSPPFYAKGIVSDGNLVGYSPEGNQFFNIIGSGARFVPDLSSATPYDPMYGFSDYRDVPLREMIAAAETKYARGRM